VFSGNDFTPAKLRRVEYLQRTTGAAVARGAAQRGPQHAEWLLSLYEERWSEPFFQWRDALAAPESPLESLG
jgi:hypothetical protein